MVKVTTDKMWFSADISGIAELITTNSHGRRVWSLARTSLKVKLVKVNFSGLRAVCVWKTSLL